MRITSIEGLLAQYLITSTIDKRLREFRVGLECILEPVDLLQRGEVQHPFLLFGVDGDLQRHDPLEVLFKEHQVVVERITFGDVIHDGAAGLEPEGPDHSDHNSTQPG